MTPKSDVTGAPHEPSIQFVSTPFAGFGDLMGFHRHLLDDTVRTQAFLDAVAATVKPGDVVVDLGTGSGILAMAACRAGARKVYAIDHSPVTRTARAIAGDNGFADRIEFLECHSSSFQPREPVDVIVSECLGLAGIGGTMFGALSDLIGRCSRPGGAVIPAAVRVCLAPVEDAAAFEYTRCWGSRYGFDFSAVQPMASNNAYIATMKPENLLDRPAVAATIDMVRDRPDGTLLARATFRANRDAKLHGLCAWFEAQLTPDRVLDTAPGKPPTIWQQTFFPLEREIDVAANSVIAVQFAVTHSLASEGTIFLQWSFEVRDRFQGFQRTLQSTERSYPA